MWVTVEDFCLFVSPKSLSVSSTVDLSSKRQKNNRESRERGDSGKEQKEVKQENKRQIEKKYYEGPEHNEYGD